MMKTIITKELRQNMIELAREEFNKLLEEYE